jgi:hypothetical protein
MKRRWWRSKEVIGEKVMIGDGQFYPNISDIQHWQTNHIRWERERGQNPKSLSCFYTLFKQGI